MLHALRYIRHIRYIHYIRYIRYDVMYVTYVTHVTGEPLSQTYPSRSGLYEPHLTIGATKGGEKPMCKRPDFPQAMLSLLWG